MITSIWAVRKIVKEINEPNDELKKIVKQHSEALDRDNKRLNKNDEDMKMILEVLYVTLEHQITGNHNNDMEATRKKTKRIFNTTLVETKGVAFCYPYFFDLKGENYASEQEI